MKNKNVIFQNIINVINNIDSILLERQSSSKPKTFSMFLSRYPTVKTRILFTFSEGSVDFEATSLEK